MARDELKVTGAIKRIAKVWRGSSSENSSSSRNEVKQYAYGVSTGDAYNWSRKR